MGDLSESPSSLFGDGDYSSAEDVWSPSLREDVFSAWHSNTTPQDLPLLRQDTLPTLSTHPPVGDTSRHRPFNNPRPPSSQSRNSSHPPRFLPRDPRLFPDPPPTAPHLQILRAPSPQSPLDLESPSPAGSRISWNSLSSGSDSDDPFVRSQDPAERGRTTHPPFDIDTSQRTSNDFVDLTEETPPRPRMTSTGSQHRPNKRRRVGPDAAAAAAAAASSPRGSQLSRTEIQSQRSAVPPHVEEVDLREVDDDKGLSKVLEEQRMATIKAQQEQASRPVKLATLSCVICMESMSDVTATYCGHLFCHKCLMEALIAGENQGSEPGKGPSKCPVCRKKIKRPGTGKRDTGQVVALEIKVRPKNDKGKGKERRGSTRSQQGPSMKRKAPTASDDWI